MFVHHVHQNFDYWHSIVNNNYQSLPMYTYRLTQWITVRRYCIQHVVC